MLVQMAETPQMKARRPTTEPVIQQPLAKIVQELPQRGAPKLGECRRTLEDSFQRHDNLLFSRLGHRGLLEVVIDQNYVEFKPATPKKNG
jgi:hypothetical protein